MADWKVWYRGKPTCPCLREWLPVLEKVLQHRGIITGQLGIYQLTGSAAASAGTHSKGGAFDLRSTDKRVVEVAREMGAPATWVRSTMSPPHIHGVLDGCPHNGPARYQITAVKNGRNGLAGNGRDPHLKPSAWRTWRQGIEWARKELNVTTTKAYTYVTKYTSPNQSSGFDPTSITIHWWGEPRSHRAGRIAGPTSWLCNKAAKASAHFVASGHDPDYGGPVAACIVALNRRAWHAGNGAGNRASVGIEMAPFDGSTPKATVDKHLEMAAMVVALVWHWAPKTRGKALRGHKSWKSTACPGNYMPHLTSIYRRAEQLYPLVDPDRPGYIRTTTKTPTPTPAKDWFTMATKKDLQEVVRAELRDKSTLQRVSDAILGRKFSDYYTTGGKRLASTVSDTTYTTSADLKAVQLEQARQAAQLDRIEKALTGGGAR